NSTGSNVADPVHTFNRSGLYSVNLTAGNSCDNYSSVFHTISVENEPCPTVVANFSSDVSSGYAPLTVSFTNRSTGGNITSWQWDFGDGSSYINTANAVHMYTTNGTYLANLTVWNRCGSSASISHPVIVISTPANAPTITNITPSTGVNTSSVNITALIGSNFESGASVNLTRNGFSNISGTNVSVINSKLITCSLPIEGVVPGNWTVEVQNPDGQRGLLLQGFTVTHDSCPDLIASYTSNISEGAAPLSVLFIDSSNGGVINSRTWNFGDGTENETNHTVIHTFTKNGTYSVSLQAKNSCGNSGQLSHKIQVSPTSVPVNYSISVLADTGGEITPSGDVKVISGENQVFNISSHSGYYISDVLVDGVSVGAVSSYLFTNITTNHSIHAKFDIHSGNYSIIASAGSGGLINPSGVIVVSFGSDQKFTFSPDAGKLISDILVDNISVGAVTSYTFTNVTSNHLISSKFNQIPGKYGINSSSNQWGKIIPSGNNAYPENSNQSFIMLAKPGTTLTNVTVDSIGIGPIRNWTFTNLTEEHSIFSEGTPIPGQILVSFIATPRWGPVPLDVQFNSRCLGDPTSFFWQFGDGGTSTEPNPTHRYNLSGVYSVNLHASNPKSGGVGVWNKYVTVTDSIIPEPTATPVPERITPMFQFSPTNGTTPLSVSFTDMSSGYPTSWLWDFGDGSTSEDQNPVHKYTTTGSYSVMLQAQNSDYSGTVTISGAITVR
ncbi:PKD domain-containing protein, partial [Methanospirillum lacunae]